MTYRIQFDSSPVYELNFSFVMFKRPFGMKFMKALDLGAEWNHNVKSMVGDAFSTKVEDVGELPFLNLIEILIYESKRKSNVDDFLQWLDQLTAGEIYEILAPNMSPNSGLTFQLDEERKKCVELLFEWNERYFSTLKQLPERFKEDVNEKEELLKIKSNEDVLLKITEGIIVEPIEELETVVLTPTIHYRPLSAVYTNRKLNIVRYPSFFGEDLLKLERNQLTNIGRALSDENRLEMLNILSTGKFNLTELAERVGTTKANLHHHLMFLRIAGLLNIHVVGYGKSLYYSLNTNFSEDLKKKLDAFIIG